MRMTTPNPTRKVVASTVGAALTTILIYVIERYSGHADPIPQHVTGALQVVVVFAFGYLVPPAARDTIVVSSTGDER